MSDQVIISIVGSVLTLISTMFVAYMTYMMARLNKKAEAAAVEVKAVAEKLDETTTQTSVALTGIAEVSEKTHTLVNSAMSAQLKISAVALRRIADLTTHQGDVAAAELAEKLDREHASKQAIVDAKG